jgi:serine/threonine-protein kinase HipA
MATGELAVLLYGQHIGILRQDSHGARSFAYTPGYAGPPLSTLMLPGPARYNRRVVDPFLEGLLPDDPMVRERIGEFFHISGNNPYALLGELGTDCAGAVQFCSSERNEKTARREGRLEEITEAEIGDRLRSIRSGRGETWTALAGQRSTLAGWQPKFTLRAENDRWFQAEGTEPTTHILKPGVPGMMLDALNEHVCLSAASALGLAAARSKFMSFAGENAVVVERYDRYRAAGQVIRIHQEDMCQALGVRPTDKYQADGGPSARDMLRIIRTHCTEADMYRFVDYLMYNYLVGSSDSHAKNFSLLILPDSTVRLAPMYDVASTLPYELPYDTRMDRMALTINGERYFGEITDQHWAAFATTADIDPQRIIDRLHQLAADIPDALNDALSAAQHHDDAKTLAKRLLPQVQQLCRAAAANTRVPHQHLISYTTESSAGQTTIAYPSTEAPLSR